MSNGGAAANHAKRAAGPVVFLRPEDFQDLIRKAPGSIVVFCPGRIWTFGRNRYLTSYKGLFFYTSSPELLAIPPGVETVVAGRMSVPR